MAKKIDELNTIAIFRGSVVRVRTMADGSPRFEFEAGEDAISVMQALAEAQANKKYLYIAIVEDEKGKDVNFDDVMEGFVDAL